MHYISETCRHERSKSIFQNRPQLLDSVERHREERAELEARANATGQSIGSLVDFDDESDPNGLVRVLLCLAKPMKYNGEGRLVEHISKAISVSIRELWYQWQPLFHRERTQSKKTIFLLFRPLAESASPVSGAWPSLCLEWTGWLCTSRNYPFIGDSKRFQAPRIDVNCKSFFFYCSSSVYVVSVEFYTYFFEAFGISESTGEAFLLPFRPVAEFVFEDYKRNRRRNVR